MAIGNSSTARKHNPVRRIVGFAAGAMVVTGVVCSAPAVLLDRRSLSEIVDKTIKDRELSTPFEVPVPNNVSAPHIFFLEAVAPMMGRKVTDFVGGEAAEFLGLRAREWIAFRDTVEEDYKNKGVTTVFCRTTYEMRAEHIQRNASRAPDWDSFSQIPRSKECREPTSQELDQRNAASRAAVLRDLIEKEEQKKALEARQIAEREARGATERNKQNAINSALKRREASYPFDVPSTTKEGPPRFFFFETNIPLGLSNDIWVGFNDSLEERSLADTRTVSVYCRTSYVLEAKKTPEGLYNKLPDWYSFPFTPQFKVCAKSSSALLQVLKA